jgi:1-acyl-sn-glycerol-3-phosphate acyltransferase
MNQMKRLLYHPYKYLIYIPIIGFFTLMVGGLCLALNLIVSQAFASRWCGFIWGRVLSYAVPMMVAVFGMENLNRRQSYVLVANHQSQLDIPLLYGWIGTDIRWVLKKELRKVPIIGICCEKLGHIIIDRSDKAAAVKAINAAREKIVNGTSILFFPEGTRSRDGNLLQFKKGAFKFALDLGIPILPISIRGTRSLLPPDTMSLFPGRVQMIIHKPIDTKVYNENRLDVLIEKTKATIASALPKDV